MNSLAMKAEPDNSTAEASSLAHKLADARRELVEDLERNHGLSRDRGNCPSSRI